MTCHLGTHDSPSISYPDLCLDHWDGLDLAVVSSLGPQTTNSKSPASFLLENWVCSRRPPPPGQPPGRGLRHSQWSGGVIVMDWAVNSSSKYLVSTSDVT